MEKKIALFYQEGSSDKVYLVQLVAEGSGYVVNFQFGRRGSTLNAGTKTNTPVSYEDAVKVYDKLVKSKIAKGYKEGSPDGSATGIAYVASSREERETGIYPQLLNPVDESELEALFSNADIVVQEKFDGKRMMLVVENGEASAINRSGLTCGAPQVVLDSAKQISEDPDSAGDLILDGESVGDIFYAFDILKYKGCDITNLSYDERSDILHTMAFNKHPNIIVVYTACSYVTKKGLFEDVQEQNKEGVVFKDKRAPYVPGRPNSGGTQLKYKFLAEATCRVASIHKSKRSFSVEVADGNGGHINVGNITIPANKEFPEVGQFVEVRYMNIMKGGNLYQPFFKGVRDDKTEADHYDTLKFKA